MKPKPQGLYPRQKRLSARRKAVTIVAGFRCQGGVIICADTQETIEKTKVHTPKLRLEPSKTFYGGDTSDDLMVAFAGSGPGPFIDKVIDRAWEDVQLATNLQEATEEIEKSIKLTYKEYGQIFQRGYCPAADIVYGVKMHGQSKLFTANDTIVNEKSTYDCIGAGMYLANFICARTYLHNMTLSQATILAAYVLFQAKEHVEGCGGDSHIAVLRDEGGSGTIDADRLIGINRQLNDVDKFIEHLLISAVDLEMSDEQYRNTQALFLQVVNQTRELHKQNKSAYEELQRILLGGKSKRPEASQSNPGKSKQGQ
jgi:20S proteasome alpha/beta subunit